MSLERLGRFRCVGRQSEQSSAHELSDGVGGQEDREPHDERDTKQPEARGGVGVDPLVEGSFADQGGDDREFYQFSIRGIDRCPVNKREWYPCCGVSQATRIQEYSDVL